MKNSLTTEDYRCRLKMSTNVVYVLEDGHRGAVVRGGQRMERKSSVSDAELEILEVLWEAEKPLNAAEIRSLLEILSIVSESWRLLKREIWLFR